MSYEAACMLLANSDDPLYPQWHTSDLSAYSQWRFLHNTHH